MKYFSNLYYEKNGKQVGPILFEEIVKLKLEPSTLVWYEGLPDWTMLKEIPELFSLLNCSIPPPLPQKNIDRFQPTQTVEEINDAVLSRGYIIDSEIKNLQRMVCQTLCSSFSQPLEDKEKEKIFKIEIKSIYILIIATMKVFEVEKPLTIFPLQWQKPIQKKIDKENIDEVSKYVGFTAAALKYLLADGRPLNYPEIQGKIPKKGILSFRQSDANKWWQNYCKSTIDKMRFVLRFSKGNREIARNFIWANSVYYLCKSQPFKFIFRDDESESEGIARILTEVINLGEILYKKL